MTHLGEGIWLHHAETRDAYSLICGRTTLYIPCVCGRYRMVPIEDEYALSAVLEDVDAHRDVCRQACTPSVRINPDANEEYA